MRLASYAPAAGTLPPSLFGLHRLRGLFLDINTISGTLPRTVGHLSSIRFLNIDGTGASLQGSLTAGVSISHGL